MNLKKNLINQKVKKILITIDDGFGLFIKSMALFKKKIKFHLSYLFQQSL